MCVLLLDAIFVAVFTLGNKLRNVFGHLWPANTTHVEHPKRVIDAVMTVPIVVDLTKHHLALVRRDIIDL